MDMEWNRKIWRRAAVLAAAALLGAALLAGCSQQGQEESSQVSAVSSDATLFPEGTTIGGENIGGKTAEEALAIAQKALEEAVDALEVSVKFKDDTVVLSGEDFTTQDVLELTLPKLLEDRTAKEHELSYVVDLSSRGRRSWRTRPSPARPRRRMPRSPGMTPRPGPLPSRRRRRASGWIWPPPCRACGSCCPRSTAGPSRPHFWRPSPR